jgi:outer membrane protein assembly factor BamB
MVAAAACTCGLGAALFGAGAASASSQPNPGSGWPTFLYNSGHTSYNAGATAIQPATLARLVQAWKWATPASPNSGPNHLFASPTVVGGVIYIGAEDGYFYAVSEANQSVLWSRFLGIDPGLKSAGSCVKRTKGITGTAAVAKDPTTGKRMVYVNAPNGYLYALSASTGKVIWKGMVGIPSATKNDYYAWGSPLVTNGEVYVGISSDSDCPLIPGGLVAFNQSTGATVAHWTDVPTTGGNAQTHGGSIWSSPALLASGDIVVTTGNGYRQPLYNESIVALDPNTLQVLGYWQVPVSQKVRDGDFGGSPTTWTATLDGVSTPMVGACNKNGLFYAFKQDHLNAGPVWKRRITVPYPGGGLECDSAADYDGHQLIVGGGAGTTINGTTYSGSVRSLNAATGAPNWQTGLPGRIVGTPTEDGGGVVAAQTFTSTNKKLGVYLLNAATGAILGFIETDSNMFGQAVFTGNDMIIGAGASFGMQAFHVAPAGSPITTVTPNIVAQGATTQVKLTGSRFSGSAKMARDLHVRAGQRSIRRSG